jgi:response regulator of citrate/malate metabolism
LKDLSVIIGESDPMLRSVYSDYVLNIPGFYLAGTAETGKELLKAMKALSPSLILMDLFLEGFGGLEGFRRARCRNRRVDFIFLSEGSPPEKVSAAVCMGAFDFLIKPFTLERFRKALLSYRDYNLGLSQRDTPWNQEDLDRFIAARRFFNPQTESPKGYQKNVIKGILALLSGYGSYMTSSEVGQHVGISRSTARRYLEFLVESGQLSYCLKYSKVGRPLKCYFTGDKPGPRRQK